MPASAKKCINSWKKYCPDYEIIEWNETNYDFTKIPYMREAYERKKWGFVPDYARLDIIHQHGGIYLDVDVELVKSYDDLLQYAGFAGFEDKKNVALGLGFGAEPGNEIIKKLKDSYLPMHFINDDGSENIVPAPGLNTKELRKEGLIDNGKLQKINDFVVFPMDYFCPKSLNDGIVRLTENTYSIHHFDASWYTEEQQREKQERWKRKQKQAMKKRVRRALGAVVDSVLGVETSRKIKRKLGMIKD